MPPISVVYDKTHIKHYPLTYPSAIGLESYPEKAARVEQIYESLHKQSLVNFVSPQPVDISILEKNHTKDYLTFLQDLKKRLTDEAYYYPTEVFHQSEKKHDNVLAELGRYSFDLSAPVDSNIYNQALVSASCAYTAALELKNGVKVAVSLSRPPGHHAMKNKMGGFCYINNTAVAAEYLSGQGKVAILDIDYHHGNGTQDIFYERDDVLTISIHANPQTDYPYYWGFADETGQGKGLGFNKNFPLKQGTQEHEYQPILENAITMIGSYKPDYLVIALGFDTYEKDSLGTFKLTTQYYKKMAETIASLNLPMVIILEGGYAIEVLGSNMLSFLSGFTSLVK